MVKWIKKTGKALGGAAMELLGQILYGAGPR